MSKRLAGVSYRLLTKRLKKFGFELKRQGKGSHEFWWRPPKGPTTVIPNHPGDVSASLVQDILSDCGITVDDFLNTK